MDNIISQNDSQVNTGLQFQILENNRSTQNVFHDKCITLGFYGSDFEYESTITAISAANYIAAAGYKVALVEPDFSKGTILNKLIPALLDNNLRTCGNVDYYPAWDLKKDIYMADIIIIDFSSMSFEETIYLSKVKKMFLCSDIVMKGSQIQKLQNNSSFKYSILYKENSISTVTLESEEIKAFTDCSEELKRLLRLALIEYGFDITNEISSENINRVQELNTVNRYYLENESGKGVKIEREYKQNDSDYMNRVENIPLPSKIAGKQQKTTIPAPQSNFNPIDLENQKKKTEKIRVESRPAAHLENKLNESDKYQPMNNYINQSMNNSSWSEIPEYDLYNNTISNNRTVPEDNNNEKLPNRSRWSEKERDIEAEQSNELPIRNSNEYEPDEEKQKNYNSDEYTLINDLNYIEDNKAKLKKKQIGNQMLFGKETIFVTGLKHGCGCTHTGLSFARYILNIYNQNICICHKKGAYELEDEDITEYTKDTDYDSIFSSNRFIIYDCGILGELNPEQLVELRRCNIKIMVCNGDEKYLGNLSKFIRKLGNTANEWVFAFNLVTSRDKETMIRRIMDGYKICFIPLHDRDDLPRKVSKMWDSVIKRNLL